MELYFSNAIVKFNQATVLKNNMCQSVCFSAIVYSVQNVVYRSGGVDFEFKDMIFSGVNPQEKKIELHLK